MENNIEIIPAIMPANPDDVRDKAVLVKGLVETVQLDIMDGQYVPEVTWPFNDKQFFGSEGEIELPFWDEVDYELDLMVAEPEKYLDTWVRVSPARIIFHYSSIKDFHKIENFAAQVRGFIDIGFAVQTYEELDPLYEHVKKRTISFVQCMGIDRIGYQGESFNDIVLSHIAKFRAISPELPISVDGGVNEENISAIVNAGANRIVSGSAIFGEGNMGDNIEHLRSLL